MRRVEFLEKLTALTLSFEEDRGHLEIGMSVWIDGDSLTWNGERFESILGQEKTNEKVR